MPRASGDKEYRLPFKGLNTEANLLDFPQDSAVDLNNLELDLNPMRLRCRLGHTDAPIDSFGGDTVGSNRGAEAYSWFLWESAGNDSDTNFLIIQQQRRIIFIDANSTDMTTSTISFLDIDDIKSGTSKGTLALARKLPLQYSKAKGDVVITSEGIDPTLIRYDVGAGTLSFTKLDMKVRDTIGLESGILVDRRPKLLTEFPVGDTASATYTQITQIHEYNLLNQGWYQARRNSASAGVLVSPITHMFSVALEFPSCADITYLGLVDDGAGEILFDAKYMQDQTSGATTAPRGHYVLEAFDMDRQSLIGAGLILSGVFSGGGDTDGSGWTDIPGST